MLFVDNNKDEALSHFHVSQPGRDLVQPAVVDTAWRGVNQSPSSWLLSRGLKIAWLSRIG
jgi:hypothetical protein